MTDLEAVTPQGRGECAAANQCGGFGVLLWDVPGNAPRCAECTGKIVGHSASVVRAMTLPGDVDEAERAAEEADIVIRHTHEDGTVVEGSERGDGVLEALKPIGFTYRRVPGIFIRGSRNHNADRWKIGRAVEAVRALGLSCVEQIEETMSFAEREAAKVAAAEERSERFEERAGKAAQASKAQRDASDQIAERFWGGQPILIGHHSEGRARRDQERIHNKMRKSIDLEKNAGYFASRAAASAAYEEYRKAPGRTLRRVEKLEAERRYVLRERDGVDDRGRSADFWRTAPSPERREELDRRLADFDEQLTYWAEVIKEAERRGFKVWGKSDFVKGDYVCYRESWYEVCRVNAKSVTIPHILAEYDGGTVAVYGGRCVVTRAATKETRHGTSTYTANYNDGVSGRMSAVQMAAALAGDPIPVDPRDAAPADDDGEPQGDVSADGQALGDVVSEAGDVDGSQGEAGVGEGVTPPHSAVPDEAAAVDSPDHGPQAAPSGGADEKSAALTDPVAVFIASKAGSPKRARVLWWMEQREAQRLCFDPRTSWANSMLAWTADPGEKGSEWEFVADRRPQETAALFAELSITPMSWEAASQRREGLTPAQSAAPDAPEVPAAPDEERPVAPFRFPAATDAEYAHLTQLLADRS